MNISVNDWVPVNPDDEDSFPKDDAYILVSFENASFVDIARYEQDEEGGAFYPGNANKSYVSIGMVVNAWRPLPKPYREQEEEEPKQTNIDKIRKMSAEELAGCLLNFSEEDIVYDWCSKLCIYRMKELPSKCKIDLEKNGCPCDTKDIVIHWLKTEVKE